MTKTRTFRVLARVFLVPQAVKAGPGRTHLRLTVGEELTIPAEAVGRFIRGRIAAGDLVEVVAPTTTKETSK